MPEDIEEELLKRKLEEESLNRKSKANVKFDYICSVRMFKNYCKQESSIKQVSCKKCGKIFKTNRDTDYCFKCEKK